MTSYWVLYRLHNELGVWETGPFESKADAAYQLFLMLKDFEVVEAHVHTRTLLMEQE